MIKHLLKVNSEDSSLKRELSIYKTTVLSKIIQTTHPLQQNLINAREIFELCIFLLSFKFFAYLADSLK